jgi:hypothetical protein
MTAATVCTPAHATHPASAARQHRADPRVRSRHWRHDEDAHQARVYCGSPRSTGTERRRTSNAEPPRCDAEQNAMNSASSLGIFECIQDAMPSQADLLLLAWMVPWRTGLAATVQS